MKKNLGWRFLAIVFVILVGIQKANATAFYVTNTNGGGAGSYDQALNDANADLSATSGTPHTIEFCTGGEIFSSNYPQNFITIIGPRDMSIKLNGNLYITSNGGSPKIATYKYITLTGTNPSSFGGCVMLGVNTTLNFINCRFTNCLAFDHGGAVFNNFQTVHFTNCTFDNNTTVSAGGVGGGAVHNNGGTTSFTNCTFSGNHTATTTADAGGGALMNNAGGTMTVTSCTFYNNTSDNTGGAIHARAGTNTFINNSIFVDNTAATTGDLAGLFGSTMGYNTVTNPTGASLTGNSTNNFTGLAAAAVINTTLADNGDYQFTHDLIALSSSVNNGAPTGVSATDQRGFGRNGGNDRGAVEYNGTNPCAGFSTSINPVAPCFTAPFNLSTTNTGGTGPFNYIWVENFTQNYTCVAALTNQLGGQYIAKVFDAVGCVAKDTVLVLDNTASVNSSSQPVPDGNNPPTPTNNTQFGNVGVGGSAMATFFIQNTGTMTPLTISSISMIKGGASKFTIGALSPAGPIAPGGSAFFTLTFNPTASGIIDDTVIISTDQCTDPVYSFIVQGTGQTSQNALRFDGFNDYVSLGNPTALQITGNLTLECWFNTNSAVGDYRTLVSKWNTAGGQASYSLLWSGATGLQFMMNDASSYLQVITNQTYNDGNWHHVAGTWDGTTASIYVDGALVNSVVNGGFGPIQTNSLNVIIGSDQFGVTAGPGADRYFDGFIDEVRIWNVARTCSQLKAAMNCELIGNETGIVGYYNFNQGAAGGTNTGVNTLTDGAGGNENGTLSPGFGLTGSMSNWVASFAPVSGTTLTLQPEIDVKSGIGSIADGSLTPSISLNTDFGSTPQAVNIVKTFTIHNQGLGVMMAPSYSLLGPGASYFSMGPITPSGPIAPGGQASFTVTFIPAGVSIQNATIEVYSNDCDESIYDFAIKAEGLSASVGGALNFDGVKDYVSVAASSDFNFETNTPFSIETWFRTASSTQSVFFSNMPNSAPYNGYEFFIGGGKIGFMMCSNFASNNYLLVNSNATYNDSVWHHAAVVYKGVPTANNVELYVDGAKVATSVQKDALTGSIANAHVAHIGARGNSGTSLFYRGSLDVMRIWDKALCSYEISGFKDCEKNSGLNLLASYNFNYGTINSNNAGINTFPDQVNGNNIGTLNGFNLNGAVSNWVAPGGVSNGNLCSGFTSPEITVKGGPLSTVIPIGGTLDYTVVEINNPMVYTFDIQNSGSAALDLQGTPKVQLSGSSDFSVTLQPGVGSISTASNELFQITFTPTSVGTKTATVTILNSDCDESSYSFTVTGSGAYPIMFVKQNGNGIFNNTTFTNFPGVVVGSTGAPVSFDVVNQTANTMLDLTGTPKIALSGADAASFAIDETGIFMGINGGSSLPFKVTFTPAFIGNHNATLTIYSDDPSANPYVFNIKALGQQPPEIDIKAPGSIASGGTVNFGDVKMLESSPALDFTIENQSFNTSLLLTGIPYVQRLLTGDFQDFTINQTGLSGGVIPIFNFKVFTVKFTPSAPGARTGTIQIKNNDPDESTYVINFTAFGLIVGDVNHNGVIDSPSEIAGDADGNGIINQGEISGDINGDGRITLPEFVGDINGNTLIDAGEIVGDINGVNGIESPEITGDRNADSTITGNEFAGDANGNGVLDIPAELVGDINGDGSISPPELAGDVNGDSTLTATETTPPVYVMNGKDIISSNFLNTYSIVPPLPGFFTYAWQYSDESMFMIKDTTRSFMEIIANNKTNNGTLACYIYQFGLPYDTLYYPITVNKEYVNIAELAVLDSACALVNNPQNKCEKNFIDFFKLNKIEYDNNGCVLGGYQDLTESRYTTDLEMGFTYTVELKPEKLFFIPNPLDPQNPDTVTIFYAIWIDYNNDGDFEDAFEYLKNGESRSLETKLINITIANNKQYEGSRRLRVGMRSGIGFSPNEACSLVGESGEMEDYLVTLVPMRQLEGPNFMSPNNDGNNDILAIKGIDTEKQHELSIMNRSGAMVYFTSSDDEEGFNYTWSGLDKNGKLVPKGTYYYVIKNGGAEFKTFLEIDY